MDTKIETYSTLWNLVDLDQTDHKMKTIATLFLRAMNDWPTSNQTRIADFIKELKEYFGSPLTIEKIKSKKFDTHNAWHIEAGSSIVELMNISKKDGGENDFDILLKNILAYYEKEFNITDFIARLTYKTAEQGGRQTPAKSGYRPQLKFDFEEMQTSGQQIFVDKEVVFPGDTIDAKIKIASPDYFAGRLFEGLQFEFREGAIVVGTGEIQYVVNDRLAKHDNIF